MKVKIYNILCIKYNIFYKINNIFIYCICVNINLLIKIAFMKIFNDIKKSISLLTDPNIFNLLNYANNNSNTNIT